MKRNVLDFTHCVQKAKSQMIKVQTLIKIKGINYHSFISPGAKAESLVLKEIRKCLYVLSHIHPQLSARVFKDFYQCRVQVTTTPASYSGDSSSRLGRENRYPYIGLPASYPGDSS
jgi:hypothetical protein